MFLTYRSANTRRRVTVIYLTCTMTITTLAMIATVLVSNLYEMKFRPVPRWVHRLVVVVLARLLCMSASDCCRHGCLSAAAAPADASDMSEPSRSLHDQTVTPGHRRLGQYALVQLNDPNDGQGRQTTTSSRDQLTAEVPEELHDADADADDDDSEEGPTPVKNPPDLTEELHQASQSTSTSFRPTSLRRGKELPTTTTTKQNGGVPSETVEEKTSSSKDWQNVAAVCDRLFFWLSLLLTATTTFLLFHPLIFPSSISTQLPEHQREHN